MVTNEQEQSEHLVLFIPVTFQTSDFFQNDSYFLVHFIIPDDFFLNSSLFDTRICLAFSLASFVQEFHRSAACSKLHLPLDMAPGIPVWLPFVLVVEETKSTWS